MNVKVKLMERDCVNAMKLCLKVFLLRVNVKS